MTPMNLYMKQYSSMWRADLRLPRWRENELGAWDKQVKTIINRMDEQQGPIV